MKHTKRAVIWFVASIIFLYVASMIIVITATTIAYAIIGSLIVLIVLYLFGKLLRKTVKGKWDQKN